jgi:hypothetical protein
VEERVKRAAGVLLVTALFLAACGDQGLLDGLGDRSREIVYGDTTTTTTIVVDDGESAPLGAIKATDVTWYNDGLGEAAPVPIPSVVIADVWARGDRVNRYIQASRAEIAAALPELEFPALVPDDVGWVTSQLVFDTASATLDAGTSAAFGLWADEPYSVEQGDVAVLRVGVATPSDRENAGEVRHEVVPDGNSLIWVRGSYRYELFCRTSMAEELCKEMADAAAPLADQLPALPAADATADASGD